MQSRDAAGVSVALLLSLRSDSGDYLALRGTEREHSSVRSETAGAGARCAFGGTGRFSDLAAPWTTARAWIAPRRSGVRADARSPSPAPRSRSWSPRSALVARTSTRQVEAVPWSPSDAGLRRLAGSA